MIQIVVYAGKPEVGAGPYYIPKINDVVMELVTQVQKVCPLGGRNLTMDRLYGSVQIAKWLLEQRMTSTCTMNHNRIGLPAEVKDATRTHLSKTVHYEKVYMTLFSKFM